MISTSLCAARFTFLFVSLFTSPLSPLLCLSTSRAQPVVLIEPNFTIAGSASVSSSLSPLLWSDNFDRFADCLCDVTFQSCDYGCLCDPNCSDAQKRLFSTLSLETVERTTIALCEDDQVVRINARGQLVTALVDSVLCVVDDNSPYMGPRFHPPTSLTSEQFDQYLDALSTFALDTVPDHQLPLPSSAPFYLAFQSLVARYTTDDGLLPLSNGMFSLPAAGSDDLCSRSLVASFTNSTESVCEQLIVDLNSECTSGGVLDITSFISGVSIAISPVAVDFVTISNNSALIVPSLSSSFCSCDNVLTNLLISVLYNQSSGVIVSVAANFTLATISAAQLSSSSGACAPLTVTQSYALSFITVDANTMPAPRAKSGNPGYLLGAKVIAGELVKQGDVDAIAQYANGLKSIGIGVCTDNTNTTTIQITFQEDLLMTCIRSFSLAQLETFCNSNTLDTVFISYLASHLQTYLGIFGNADLNYINQWLSIDNNTLTLTPTMAWDNNTLQCLGVASTLSLELAIADLGAFNNPQLAIISARWRQGFGTWSWTSSSIASNMSFALNFIVTFVHLPTSGVALYFPDATPLFPPLPQDIFYPLYGNSSEQLLPFLSWPLLASFLSLLSLYI